DLPLAGHAPKQIARQLGLSIWTVREYIQNLYSHFHVSGRDERMSRFVGAETPAWLQNHRGRAMAAPACAAYHAASMFDKPFVKWWFTRVTPFVEVPPDKLAAEREAIARQQTYNENYHKFMTNAVLPSVDALVKVLAAHRVVHRVTT